MKLSENEKQEYRESILSKIRSLQEELSLLVGQLKDKDLTTEELKTRILDKHTNEIIPDINLKLIIIKIKFLKDFLFLKTMLCLNKFYKV